MVFKNITHDEFDWSWEGSKDGGKTWTVVWPIHYKRKCKANASDSDPQRRQTLLGLSL